ncbi:FAD-dependent oxidoreductase [Moorella sulfitireducens]|uniref:FAD-dependent oxidoreductase n=1 Tax=Neomoorella sulfitireducens TaxID=2972948 RepID=UPI0021ABA9BA|nr:FAD-dependent oxidoreductase [Moorella sulfitireducens]
MNYYNKLIEENAIEWPYPVKYDKENEDSSDVLIIGGGIAGCYAAISAAKRGVQVAVVDKASVKRSGAGGPGVDHWHLALTNPCSKITPEEMISVLEDYDPYISGHAYYITMKESYDALLDLEEMGVKIRDIDDKFVGAEFRDEETKLMFAYDYENKHIIRVQGADAKLALCKELVRLGVKIYHHVMATSLLTEGGKQGGRVVGATGVNVHTGEFYIFKAKATILCTAKPLRLWNFSTELIGSNAAHDDPNCAGDGCAIAWKAGAELMMMEKSMPSSGGYRYPAYGTGNAHNTWYACTIVDANGKEIPWVDRDGRILKTVSERYRPAPGQKFFLPCYGGDAPYEIRGPHLIPDLSARIKNGEYKLPFYADLPSMPEHERKAIFGLMVGNEGKTKIPIYKTYTDAGFDPDKDMLQANVLHPDFAGLFEPWWDVKATGIAGPQSRETAFKNAGGLVTDWDLKTSLEGLFAAGNQVAGIEGYATAAATGRYVGRKATEYALTAGEAMIDREQVEREKARVYSPVRRKDGIGWKELQLGLCRIMQDYCGEYKSEEILQLGLLWLSSFRESELPNLYALNPHELARALECEVRLTVGEIIMHASLARKASSKFLDFKRMDYPDFDPPEWNKFVTIKLDKGEVKVNYKPFKYWLQHPYKSTYKENYREHCGL